MGVADPKPASVPQPVSAAVNSGGGTGYQLAGRIHNLDLYTGRAVAVGAQRTLGNQVQGRRCAGSLQRVAADLAAVLVAHSLQFARGVRKFEHKAQRQVGQCGGTGPDTGALGAITDQGHLLCAGEHHNVRGLSLGPGQVQHRCTPGKPQWLSTSTLPKSAGS